MQEGVGTNHGRYGQNRTVQKQGGSDFGWIPNGVGYSSPATIKGNQTSALKNAISSVQGSIGNFARASTSGNGAASAARQAAAAAAAAAARNAAIRNNYKGFSDRNAAVYDSAENTINGQAPGIKQSYQTGIDAIRKDATNRALEDRRVSYQRGSDAAAAAAAMGLPYVPATGGQAAVIQGANRAKLGQNAETWAGLLTAQQGTALQRNQAQAGTFEYAKTEQEALIAKALRTALGLA